MAPLLKDNLYRETLAKSPVYMTGQWIDDIDIVVRQYLESQMTLDKIIMSQLLSSDMSIGFVLTWALSVKIAFNLPSLWFGRRRENWFDFITPYPTQSDPNKGLLTESVHQPGPEEKPALLATPVLEQIEKLCSLLKNPWMNPSLHV